jgi:hypothetical protein
MAERFAHHAGVLAACRKRGVEGLLLIPSVRTAIGVTLSFIYGQAFEDWASGDSIDFLHAPSAAATAEVFVTNDTHLREAIVRIPLNDLRPMSLSEFLTASNPTDYTH